MARPFGNAGNSAVGVRTSDAEIPELTRMANARRSQVDFGHNLATQLEDITDKLAGSAPTPTSGDTAPPKHSGLLGELYISEAHGNTLNERLERVVSRLARLV